VRFPLLIQGSAPRTALLEKFRNTEGAVLFATSSFWQGVDVRGEQLSCVIVDRLPFAVPSDPIVAARVRALQEDGRNAFAEYQVPEAVLALKQGFGRLIRSRTDRGRWGRANRLRGAAGCNRRHPRADCHGTRGPACANGPAVHRVRT